jgi:hypothetical protein
MVYIHVGVVADGRGAKRFTVFWQPGRSVSRAIPIAEYNRMKV